MLRKSRKISVLGTGNVGATIAYSLTLSGLCSEIVLVDVNKAKAEGEALDLAQCAACTPSVKVRCGEYEDVAGSDIFSNTPYPNCDQILGSWKSIISLLPELLNLIAPLS